MWYLFLRDARCENKGDMVLLTHHSIIPVTPTLRYVSDLETREEGGTPLILGIVKCGLALKLQVRGGEMAPFFHAHAFSTTQSARASSSSPAQQPLMTCHFTFHISHR